MLGLGLALALPAGGARAEEPVEVTGWVQLQDNLFCLVTDSGCYYLDGIDETLEGRPARVAGTLERGRDGRQWLVVDKAEEMP
jgi:hypothetical protein